ncbi:unnamed protein product [Rhizopus stolonifer]
MNVPKKPLQNKLRAIPAYPYRVIKEHTLICFRCNKQGKPNGPKNDAPKVICGPHASRLRLLLCVSCSLACHNSCLPQGCSKSFDEDNQYTCSKCRLDKTCTTCEKSLEKKGKFAFRCRSCFRAYHSDCVDSDLIKEGECNDCVTNSALLPQKIVAQKTTEKDGQMLLIRWKEKSFRHTTWVPTSWVKAHYANILNIYRKNFGDEDTEPKKGRYFPVEWTTIERILNVEWEDQKNNIPKRVLAVFKDTAYEEALWDDIPSKDEPGLYAAYELAFERYLRATKVKPPQKVKQLIADIRQAADTVNYASHELKAQPKYIDGGKLMKHQLDALNWLLFQWEKQQSCVLADDMGLGKTIQVISFLYVLFRKYSIYPFIIVVPNSTATNWIREFQKWAPDMAVVPFFGLGVSRRLALDNEIFDKNQNLRCHAVVATYESIQESTKLQKIFWPVMIVDESQRLKNDESFLFRTLKQFHKDHSVLLTGTPLQNNLRELFNIMHFIRPQDFHGEQADDYSDMTREQVDNLHSRLRPYFLRRTKEEILKTLPPKHEIIVPLSMSTLQKQVYKSCLSRDIESILGASAYKRSKGLTMVFVNLRKVLNHPYLIDGVESPRESEEETHRAMIDACEKLKFFHQMLAKLRAQGHRVLVFSTMTRALDVLDDYLTYEGIEFVRLDGGDSERERVRSIDAFNAPKSKVDVFLLSTRAGGVGINLATADTIIIWDSDFNPYADLQAIGRAHRIGQTKMVLIYRFMTRLSVEERVLQIGRKKMALEHVVVEKMSSVEEDEVEDIESILKFGAQALFDNDESADISYDSAAIDRLLDREQYKAMAESQKEKDIDEAKNTKGSMSFGYAKVWKSEGGVEDYTDTQVIEEEQDDFWEKFLEKKKEEMKKKKAEKKLHDMNLGRGARKRAQVSYSEKEAAEAEGKQAKKQKSLIVEKDDDYTFDHSDVPSDIEEEEGVPEDVVGDVVEITPAEAKKQLKKTKVRPLEREDAPLPQIDARYPEQLNAALQTIFERHCNMVYEYLVACGRDRIDPHYYHQNIQSGIKQLTNSLRLEFKNAISQEKHNLEQVGTPRDTVKAYVKTKRMIFEKILVDAVVQFDKWRYHNEPLLIELGEVSRVKKNLEVTQRPDKGKEREIIEIDIDSDPIIDVVSVPSSRTTIKPVPGPSQQKQAPIQPKPQAIQAPPQQKIQIIPQNQQQVPQQKIQAIPQQPLNYNPVQPMYQSYPTPMYYSPQPHQKHSGPSQPAQQAYQPSPQSISIQQQHALDHHQYMIQQQHQALEQHRAIQYYQAKQQNRAANQAPVQQQTSTQATQSDASLELKHQNPSVQ